MAHGADDQAAGHGRFGQALQQGFDGGFTADAKRFKQQRRDAEFRQDHALRVGVLRGFACDAAHGLGAGHGGHGQRKAVQVLFQTAGVGVGVEPGGQLGFVRCGWRHATLAQQVQQGGHAQAAVQVFVQQHLGQAPGLAQQIRPGMGGRRAGH